MYWPRNSINKGLFFVAFIFSAFSWGPAFCQPLTKSRVDTVSLRIFESIKLSTNNGTACTTYVSNPSGADIATIVNIGAPDSIRLDNNTLFNGIHQLTPGQQLIAVGDFMGKQLSIVNFSLKNVSVTVAIYCPGN